MKLTTLNVGNLATNCYLITLNNHLYIIDPGDDFSKIIKAIGNQEVYAILVTHHYFDHINALNLLESNYHIKHNTIYTDFKIIKTPGHTSDSLTFYNEENKIMFCGDFLFQNSYGRTDLGGNKEDMIRSFDIIDKYDDGIKMYPGHGDYFMLKDAKKNFNLYKKTLN